MFCFGFCFKGGKENSADFLDRKMDYFFEMTMQSLAQLLINLVFLGIFRSLIKACMDVSHQRSERWDSVRFAETSVDKFFFFVLEFLG